MRGARFARPSTGFLLLALTGVIWGTIGPAANGVFDRTDLSPAATAWLRFAAAAPFIVAVGWRSMGRGLLRMSGRAFAGMAILGALIFAFQLFYLYAIQQIGVTAATLITLCSIPIMVASISSLFLGERHGRATWLSLGLAILGTALLVVGKPGGGGADGSLLLGALFALLSAGGASAYSLGSRRANRELASLQILTGSFLSGILLFAPITATAGFTLHVPLSAWLLIAYLGVVTQGVAYLCFQRGLETETATTASVVTLLEPLVAAILAWVFFDERLSAVSWGGAALLIGALLLLTVATTRGQDGDSPVTPVD